MSLDQNLFTLVFTPHKDNNNVVDLVDPAGTVHYRKQRMPGVEYKIEVYDPMSESLLAVASAPSPTSKLKSIELYNPTSVVELKFTGTLTFRWGFKWEDHEFEWKREECFMIRKPDPPVIIAITKEPAGRLKTTSVQMLDYNLNRFDIDDRKGLEIVVLTALMTFHDSNEAHHTPDPTPSTSSSNPLSRAASAFVGTPTTPVVSNDAPPLPPPKPAPKTGIDRIAEMQAIKGEYNEISVSGEGSVQEYGEYCNTLLQDEAMLFITVKSTDAEHVPKVLQVVEETKRIRHKAGLSDEEELHQYVLYDTPEPKKGPRRINLDDEPKNKYAPPKNLTIHLSKIPLPELQPKGQSKDKHRGSVDLNRKKDERREDKKATVTTSKPVPAPAPPATRPAPSKPTNARHNKPPPSSQSPYGHAHQVHPNAPTSFSQPTNTSAHPAPPPNSRLPNTAAYANPSGVAPSGGISFPQPWGGAGKPASGGSAPPQTPYSAYSATPPTYSNASSFNPVNWTPPPGPPPAPQIYQPQPLNANQSPATAYKPTSGGSSFSQGASTVVQGLMDKLTRR